MTPLHNLFSCKLFQVFFLFTWLSSSAYAEDVHMSPEHIHKISDQIDISLSDGIHHTGDILISAPVSIPSLSPHVLQHGQSAKVTNDAHNQGSSLLHKIKTAIEEKNYALAGALFEKNLGRDKGNKLRLSELHKLGEELKFQPLLNAIQATRNFADRRRGLGLTVVSTGEFLKTALFIETELPAFTRKHKFFLPSKVTDLKNSLEFDPETKEVFIVLDGSSDTYVGRGKKKTVHKAILYNTRGIKVFARAEQSIPMEEELKMCRRLKNAPGLLKTRNFTQHKNKGKKYTTIYSPLYFPGSFRDDLFEGNKFSLYEKLRIFLGILNGLESLHARNLVHRDLHSRNYLMNIPKGPMGKRNIEAVIADFGRTIHIKKCRGLSTQGGKRYIPPESFFKKKMKGKDYFQSDIFAVGCVFYRLFNTKLPGWQDDEYLIKLKSSKKSSLEKQQNLIKKIRAETDKRRSFLATKKTTDILNVKEDVEFLILKMISIDPVQRGTAAKLRAECERIYKRLETQNQQK